MVLTGEVQKGREAGQAREESSSIQGFSHSRSQSPPTAVWGPCPKWSMYSLHTGAAPCTVGQPLTASWCRGRARHPLDSQAPVGQGPLPRARARGPRAPTYLAPWTPSMGHSAITRVEKEAVLWYGPRMPESQSPKASG